MKVEIYGATWCAPCQQAKKLCDANGVEYVYVDIDDTSSLRQLEDRLGYAVKSVPQIFYDDAHLTNGIKELQELLNTNK